MEVSLDKRYPLTVSRAQAWAILGDVRATAACMPGAAITEALDATHYKGTVKSKVGPATMTFGGDIEVLEVDAQAHRLRMLGRGSDNGGSSASMDLAAVIEPGTTADDCVLAGHAVIIVNGKLAQFGSRLLVPVADMMLAKFAQNFGAAAAQVVVAAPAAVASTPVAVAAAPAETAPQAVEALNMTSFGWALVKQWFAGLFGRRA